MSSYAVPALLRAGRGGAAPAPRRPAAGSRDPRSVWERMAAGASQRIPQTYDAIFQRVATSIPFQLLKANSWEESRYKADARPPVSKTTGKPISSATGLGQILKATLDLFNKQNGYSYTLDDMTDPEKNGMVQAWLFNKIAKSLNEHAGWPINWDDPNFVAAVLLAYGAGSTQVPIIVGKMHAAGKPFSEITTDAIRKAAGIMYPSSGIYVDPKLADAQGKGPYMSNDEIGRNVADKLRYYLELRPAAVAAIEDNAGPWADPAAARAPYADAYDVKPQTQQAPAVPKKGDGWTLLLIAGLGIAGYRLLSRPKRAEYAL